MFFKCCKRRPAPLASQVVESCVVDLTDWECPICFGTVDEVSIAFPYRCAHPACFKCLGEQCAYFRNKGAQGYDVTCCLCRAPVNDYWRQNIRISSREITTKNDIVAHVYEAGEN